MLNASPCHGRKHPSPAFVCLKHCRLHTQNACMHDALFRTKVAELSSHAYTNLPMLIDQVDSTAIMHLELICKKHTEHKSHQPQQRLQCIMAQEQHRPVKSEQLGGCSMCCNTQVRHTQQQTYRLCSGRLPDGICHASAQHTCGWAQPYLLRYQPATPKQAVTIAMLGQC